MPDADATPMMPRMAGINGIARIGHLHLPLNHVTLLVSGNNMKGGDPVSHCSVRSYDQTWIAGANATA
jgi:hypothetical protein